MRLDELVKMDLFDISVQVARHFMENGKDRLSFIGMKTIIRQVHMDLGMDAKDSSVADTRTRLVSIGFIWKTTPGDSTLTYYEPGIPSLMNYVVNESLRADVDESLKKKPSVKPRGFKRRL